MQDLDSKGRSSRDRAVINELGDVQGNPPVGSAPSLSKQRDAVRRINEWTVPLAKAVDAGSPTGRADVPHFIRPFFAALSQGRRSVTRRPLAYVTDFRETHPGLGGRRP